MRIYIQSCIYLILIIDFFYTDILCRWYLDLLNFMFDNYVYVHRYLYSYNCRIFISWQIFSQEEEEEEEKCCNTGGGKSSDRHEELELLPLTPHLTPPRPLVSTSFQTWWTAPHPRQYWFLPLPPSLGGGARISRGHTGSRFSILKPLWSEWYHWARSVRWRG